MDKVTGLSEDFILIQGTSFTELGAKPEQVFAEKTIYFKDDPVVITKKDRLRSCCLYALKRIQRKLKTKGARKHGKNKDL